MFSLLLMIKKKCFLKKLCDGIEEHNLGVFVKEKTRIQIKTR
jgi:hypothetical protein